MVQAQQGSIRKNPVFIGGRGGGHKEKRKSQVHIRISQVHIRKSPVCIRAETVSIRKSREHKGRSPRRKKKTHARNLLSLVAVALIALHHVAF